MSDESGPRCARSVLWNVRVSCRLWIDAFKCRVCRQGSADRWLCISILHTASLDQGKPAWWLCNQLGDLISDSGVCYSRISFLFATVAIHFLASLRESRRSFWGCL
ncbi:hypothetical protein MAP00_007940 [Monascus purpureus]|nr:hypothetical protein MAP00_007940 [Monascus purpureus]